MTCPAAHDLKAPLQSRQPLLARRPDSAKPNATGDPPVQETATQTDPLLRSSSLELEEDDQGVSKACYTQMPPSTHSQTLGLWGRAGLAWAEKGAGRSSRGASSISISPVSASLLGSQRPPELRPLHFPHLGPGRPSLPTGEAGWAGAGEGTILTRRDAPGGVAGGPALVARPELQALLPSDICSTMTCPSQVTTHEQIVAEVAASGGTGKGTGAW